VADAIIAGDGVMAETTMRELIQEALDLVCEAEANEQLRGTNVRKSNSM
jgi:DNA-binding GntR family transcriptional regulator